jgi:hypothetical protein|tara:strand:+ start:294 stop:452 length:159 start_codon:yes stop_codon:yes gene_type:complete
MLDFAALMFRAPLFSGPDPFRLTYVTQGLSSKIHQARFIKRKVHQAQARFIK